MSRNGHDVIKGVFATVKDAFLAYIYIYPQNVRALQLICEDLKRVFQL